MSTLALIHGAWHGAWCWEKVVPQLQNKHNILNLNLPGRDYQQPGDLKDINLSTYVEHVVQQLEKISDPIILVGHSMAGMVISQVAEHIGDRLSALVYIAAFVPKHHESLFDITRLAEEPGISTEFIANQSENYIDLKKSERTQSLFLNASPNEAAQVAMNKLNKEPFMAFVEKSDISKSAFQNIPQFYIKCLRDQAVLPVFQDKMIAKLNQPTILELDADHSPFLSNPEGLVEILSDVISNFSYLNNEN